MKRKVLQGFFWLALLFLCACSASQKPDETATTAVAADALLARAWNPACPDMLQWDAARLHGAWDVELTDLDEYGQLELSQHPEFKASLRGHFKYADDDAIASGDLSEGHFNLDESRDGKRLYAFWTGYLVPQACGEEIRGEWERLETSDQPGLKSAFVLRRSERVKSW